MSYLIFDTETTNKITTKRKTSQFTYYPRIVQIAWLSFNKGIISTKTSIVKPNFIIPEESVKIHGITNEIAKNGEDLKDVLMRLKDEIDKVKILIAHNAEFDTKMISSECYRLGIPDFLKGKKVLCTMRTTTNLCQLPGKYGYKYPKLKELYFYLYKKNHKEKEHDALSDCMVTNRCWLKLLSDHKGIEWKYFLN
jgi:DNA polymerase-3 subunit epsilon